jgi:hypothetical protein
MANELEVDWGITGLTVYFLVRSSVGTIWNGATLVTYVSANYSTYPVTGTEQGGSGSGSGFYQGNMPAVAAGTWNVTAKQQVGGSPAQSDPTIGNGTLTWDGSFVPGAPANFSSLEIDSNGDVSLGLNGMDRVTVETGLNARQALSIIAASVAGELSGAGTNTIDIQAANNNATQRIGAGCDSLGNRNSVTLNIPA